MVPIDGFKIWPKHSILAIIQTLNNNHNSMSSQQETLLDEVIHLLNKFTDESIVINESHHLMRDLELDSVKVMELMMELEDHFDISIPLNSLPNVNSVSDLAAEIAKLKSQ